jgi:hypothetical protein
MNDTALFLEKEKINNFDDIIEVIKTSGITPGTIAIEHIGDVIFFLNKRDKKRDMDDPELKRATFTVIKTLLDLEIAEPLWRDSWVESVRTDPPKTQQELFAFLDKYWYEKHSSGLDRNYLVFFKRKGQTWPY